MAALIWDTVGSRFYETGVQKGVLYIPNASGVYDTGVAWNGLVTVTESPTGAEANAQYADNIKYLNLYSVEEFGATIEAFTYPDEWNQFDGLTLPAGAPGLTIGQQPRKLFGLSYQTLIGSDLNDDLGYKIHLVYGCKASPSEKAYSSVNDSPEPITFSWEVMTTPVAVTGAKPTSLLTIDSTKVPAANMTALQNALYATGGGTANLPLPDQIISILSATITTVTTVAPTATTAGVITIPTVAGVTYRRADTNAIVTNAATVQVPGAIGSSLTIKAEPASTSYTFSAASDSDWVFTKTV
jgi:hypothetical protein